VLYLSLLFYPVSCCFFYLSLHSLGLLICLFRVVLDLSLLSLLLFSLLLRSQLDSALLRFARSFCLISLQRGRF